MSKGAIRESIRANAVFDPKSLLMNAFAAIVASYGLLEDSPAVIIGAMVMATLLGPISGIALALVDDDNRLLVSSFVTELAGILLVLTVSFIVGGIHNELPLTHEIVSRTDPGIPDLMIALAGGAGGAIAVLSPRISSSIVGVAIATALVPPLASCGICLAHHERSAARGAFLLFATNLVAIQFASSVVMWAHGFRGILRSKGHRGIALAGSLVSVALMVMLTSVVGYDFSQIVSKTTFQTTVRNKLTDTLVSYPGVYLADLRFSESQGRSVVTAVLRTPKAFGPGDVSALAAEMNLPPSMNVELHVRSVITQEASANR